MRRSHIVSRLFTFLMIIVLSACGAVTPAPNLTEPESPVPAATESTELENVPTEEPAEEPEATPENISTPDPATVAEFREMDPANFPSSPVIDNVWMPMKPGMRWVLEGNAVDEEGNSLTRRIDFTITDLTKEIGGVQTVVAWIVDYNDGEVIEKEIAFYAQDKDGNVWYFGEHPEEYENGEFVKASPWIHGIEGARAGVKMVKDPHPGIASYYQGWGPAVDWSDYGTIDQVGQETCAPADCYSDVLVIAESSLGETDAYQLKYYAPNVGEVQVGWRGEDATQEDLALIEFVQLSPEELVEIRAMALELEQHAYEVSSEIYAATAPLEYSLQPEAVAEFRELDPARFSNPTNITNSWMPMRPGMHWVYEGNAVDEEGNSIERKIEFTVTNLTKEIAGVRTLVAWILDYNDGEVIEREIAFYAQDDEGNVWYFGEYPEELENGEFVKASPWIHGIEAARAGIKMVAQPQLGIASYYQGWGPAVDWSDYGTIDHMGQETCVQVDCFTDVLVIAESSLGETDAYQLKYYAPGVGEIQVGWKGEDASQEDLQLVELVQLGPGQLAEVNGLATDLEKHAYEINQELYVLTSPLQ